MPSKHGVQGATSLPIPRGRLARSRCSLRQRDFKRIVRTGKRVRGKQLSICFCRGVQSWSRLGLAVSKRVGNAPQRTRLRRLCRESFRGLRHDWSTPLDLVVMARVPWSELRLEFVERELLELLKKVRWSTI